MRLKYWDKGEVQFCADCTYTQEVNWIYYLVPKVQQVTRERGTRKSYNFGQ